VPEFLCRIGAPDGSVLEQRRLGVSAEALRRELEGEGYHIFSIETPKLQLGLPGLRRRDKVSGQDFLVFNTQLRTLLKAGLPLAQSLELLKDQQTTPAFRALLDKVYQQVTTGVALSDAFLSLGDVFPPMYANSLRAGERSGNLPYVLERFIEYQRLMEEARKKIVGALTYPLVLIGLSIGLVVILMTYVIPKFTDFYAGMGATLPLPTKIVIGVSHTMSHHVVLIGLATLGTGYALRSWSRTVRGRKLLDRMKLGVPVVGRLIGLFGLTQFTRSLAVLLDGGTPMVPALETAATSVNNIYMSDRFLECVPEVQEGQSLSDALSRRKMVPDLALAMVRVGESTGALAEMLTHTSEFFDSDIDLTLGRLVTLIEPAILLVMAVVVAGLLLAVYYPLLTLVTRMQ
jgi:type IV pilus assembly protein PilC